MSQPPTREKSLQVSRCFSDVFAGAAFNAVLLLGLRRQMTLQAEGHTHVYVCICMYMYVYIYIYYTHTYTHLQMHKEICMHMYTCLHACRYVGMHKYVRTCTFVSRTCV